MNDMEEDKNYINLIRGDLTKASQAHNGMPDSVGMMNIKTANQTILEASLLPTPRALWDSFWYEGELSCLFADSNVGKSILAVQIADRSAIGRDPAVCQRLQGENDLCGKAHVVKSGR